MELKDGYIQNAQGHKQLAVGILCEDGVAMPRFEHSTDSGFDLSAAEHAVLEPYTWKAISTGLKVVIPPGYEIQVRPRSGLALNSGVTVLNTPGTVDEGFTGTLKVILLNVGRFPVHIVHGQRIAQAVVAPVVRPVLVAVSEMPTTDRGANGFGSTGA